MFAKFDENPAMTLQDIKKTKRYGRTKARTDARTDNVKKNPAMTLQDIKKTKRYGRTEGQTHARTHGHTHAQRENSIPTTNKVCGGYNKFYKYKYHMSLDMRKPVFVGLQTTKAQTSLRECPAHSHSLIDTFVKSLTVKYQI